MMGKNFVSRVLPAAVFFGMLTPPHALGGSAAIGAIAGSLNATVGGDPTSTHCAHSFVLDAWDRVINGWGYIHGVAQYQKFITLMF